MPSPRTTLIAFLSCVGTALGQDSVPFTPGGNDALSAYDQTVQRVRYVVDAVPLTTSWGNPLQIAPLLKASRDVDPLFRTQVLGSAAVSPTLLVNPSFPQRSFRVWNAAGAGVNPTFNSAAATVGVGSFGAQFGVAASDFSLNPSNVVSATVGRDAASPSRLYVERVVALVSRPTAEAADTSTVSLGVVDPSGNVFVRADGSNAAAEAKLTADSVLLVSTAARAGGAVNALSRSGATTIATDGAATSFLINSSQTPLNPPAAALKGAGSQVGLIFDFTSRLRSASPAAVNDLAATHLSTNAALDLVGHRGNPAYSPVTAAGGSLGTVASLAKRRTAARVDVLNAAGLSPGAGGLPAVAPGTQRAYQLPVPITGPGFSANATGQAEFRGYLSQISFRGGNGTVAIGTNPAGTLVLAATASEAAFGDFIAVCTASGPGAWTVAARAGQPVLGSMNGAPIGSLTTPTATLSAPAMDRQGNVYFVGTWKPTLTPEAVGLFRAVNTPTGYQLELMLSTGQSFVGANSTRTYTVTQLTLTDLDSLASGAFHAHQLIQDPLPGAVVSGPTSIGAFGGLIVNALLTYNNGGANEAYDAVLFVGPGVSPPSCPADFDQQNGVQVADIFAFLRAWFANSPSADFDAQNGIQVADIFAFLRAWFAGC